MSLHSVVFFPRFLAKFSSKTEQPKTHKEKISLHSMLQHEVLGLFIIPAQSWIPHMEGSNLTILNHCFTAEPELLPAGFINQHKKEHVCWSLTCLLQCLISLPTTFDFTSHASHHSHFSYKETEAQRG